MKAKKVKATRSDSGKTNYIVLFLLVASVLAVAITYRLTERGCLSSEFNQPKTVDVGNQTELNKTIQFVNDAVALVNQNGEKAFLEFKKEDGAWRKGDLYVFVYDTNGKTIVLPPQPELEGINRLNVKDQNGVYFVKEMVNQTRNSDSGWLLYSYPKPGERTAVEKLAYFKKVKVGAKNYIVGAGLYLQ